MNEEVLENLENPDFRSKYGMYHTIEENYTFIASNPSDQKGRDSIMWIAPYMEVLRKYASECDHVTEFGINQVNSTYAFLAAKPNKLVSVDIDLNRRASQKIREFKGTNLWLVWAKRLADESGIVFETIQYDSAKVDIEPTDLLFIDSKHTNKHLRAELSRHKDKVRKYIIFHDTTLFGGEIMPPIRDLLAEGVFEEVETFKTSPGLMVVKRKEI
jgi:hypothetical protein